MPVSLGFDETKIKQLNLNTQKKTYRDLGIYLNSNFHLYVIEKIAAQRLHAGIQLIQN